MKNLFLIFTLCNLTASDLLDEPAFTEESYLNFGLALNPVLQDWLSDYSTSFCGQPETHLPGEVSQSPETNIQCVFCLKPFLRKSLLVRHLVANHADSKGFMEYFISHGGKPEKIHHCAQCSFITLDKNHFAQHTARHSGQKLHYCNLCSRGFNLVNDLRRHKFSIHQEDVADFKSYACTKCSASFTKKCLLINHLASHEKTIKAPSLAISSSISKKTKNNLKFNDNLGFNSIPDTSPTAANINFKITSAPISQNMLNLQKPDLQHKSTEKKLLVESKNAVENEIGKICLQCGLKAKSRANLLVHMARHQKKPLYFCEYCPWGCYLKNDLSRHIISKHPSHANPALGHVCKDCQIIFPRKDHLAKHEKTHQIASLDSALQASV